MIIGEALRLKIVSYPQTSIMIKVNLYSPCNEIYIVILRTIQEIKISFSPIQIHKHIQFLKLYFHQHFRWVANIKVLKAKYESTS